MIIRPDSAGPRLIADPAHLSNVAERLAYAWRDNRQKEALHPVADAYLHALADLLMLKIDVTERMLQERWPGV